MIRIVLSMLMLAVAPSALACGMYVPNERMLLADLLEEIDDVDGEEVPPPVEAEESDRDGLAITEDEEMVVISERTGKPLPVTDEEPVS